MDIRSTHISQSHVNIAIIDLECTCNNDEIFGPNEIVEIGAVAGKLFVGAFETVAKLQIYVRPTINSILTSFCTNLTGISQDTVNSSTTLDSALPGLKSWLQKNNVEAWASWGKFDANHFVRECELKSLRNRWDKVNFKLPDCHFLVPYILPNRQL